MTVAEIEFVKIRIEDLDTFIGKAPSAMFFLGMVNQGHVGYLLHHPKLGLDESAFPIGTAILVRTALKLLK